MGVGSQRHAPVALSPEKSPGAHCTGGRVSPKASVDRRGKFCV